MCTLAKYGFFVSTLADIYHRSGSFVNCTRSLTDARIEDFVQIYRRGSVFLDVLPGDERGIKILNLIQCIINKVNSLPLGTIIFFTTIQLDFEHMLTLSVDEERKDHFITVSLFQDCERIGFVLLQRMSVVTPRPNMLRKIILRLRKTKTKKNIVSPPVYNIATTIALSNPVILENIFNYLSKTSLFLCCGVNRLWSIEAKRTLNMRRIPYVGSLTMFSTNLIYETHVCYKFVITFV